MKVTHEFETMTEDKRPQDPSLRGDGWTFETLEHGGEYPDCMPQAIRATDAEGRSCIYLPVTHGGRVVDSKGFRTEVYPSHQPPPNGGRLDGVVGIPNQEKA